MENTHFERGSVKNIQVLHTIRGNSDNSMLNNGIKKYTVPGMQGIYLATDLEFEDALENKNKLLA